LPTTGTPAGIRNAARTFSTGGRGVNFAVSTPL
jgi:hypothetical protein